MIIKRHHNDHFISEQQNSTLAQAEWDIPDIQNQTKASQNSSRNIIKLALLLALATLQKQHDKFNR